MRFGTGQGVRLAVAAVLIAVQVPLGVARDHRRPRRPDVDIEKLKATLRPSRGGYSLDARYEVEIEDCRPGERFVIVFHVTERGRVLTDRAGRRVEYVAPLDRPVDVDDDEMEFKDGLRIRLRGVRVHNPTHLRLHARVAYTDDGPPLGRDSTSVKFRHRRALIRPQRTLVIGGARVSAWAPSL